MKLSGRSHALVDYGFALFVVALAFSFTLLIPALFGSTPSLLFFAAVTLSAWYGGFGPGILASLLSLLIVRQFFLTSVGALLFNTVDLPRLVAFLVVTGIVGTLHRQRQRTLEALRRSRDQLDIYLRDMANGIMVQDTSGKVIYANYEAAKLMGFVSGEALLQHSADEVLEPYEIFDEFGEPMPASSLPGRLALLGMQYPETVLRVRYKDSGRERWAYDKARPVFDENGSVQSAISLFLDITELKHAQQLLAQQQEQLRVTLLSIGDAVIATDSDGNVTFVNPLAEAITGWQATAAVGKPITEVIHIIDQQTSKTVDNLFGRVKEGVSIRLADHLTLAAKDGTERSIEVTGTPIRDEQDRLIGAVLVFRDITERRMAEVSLQARAHQQEIVAALGLRALTDIDLQSLMDEAAEQVAQTLQIEYVEILRALPAEKSLLLQAGVGWIEGRVGHATVDAGKNSHGGFTLVSQEPVILEDLHTETRFAVSPLLREHNVISGMSVIISGGSSIWGVLGVHTIRQRGFTKDDIHFLQAVANLLALSIEHDRVERAEHEQRIFAEALRDTAEALSHSLDLGQVLDRILENVERVVPHDAADIMMIEGDNAHVVRYRGYNEYTVSVSLLDLRLPLATTASLQQVISTGKPLLIADTRTFPGWVKVPGMEWLLSYLAVPLLVQGEVKGFLNVSNVTPDYFTAAQANRLESFAAQASVAIRNAQLYDQARKTSENKAVS